MPPRTRSTSVKHSDSAGLVLPVGKLSRYLHHDRNGISRVSKARAAHVYFTAILEYLAIEITLACIKHASQSKTYVDKETNVCRLMPIHLTRTAVDNRELGRIMGLRV